MIVSSELRDVTTQANGSFNVVERHTDSNGKVYEFVYNAASDADFTAIMNARAAKIDADLAAQAAIEAEAQNYALPLTHLQFMTRFTMEERFAILAAANTDPIIDYFLELLKISDYIYPTHEMTQAGLQYMVSQNLLTSERAAEVGS
mgnify:FL=1